MDREQRILNQNCTGKVSAEFAQPPLSRQSISADNTCQYIRAGLNVFGSTPRTTREGNGSSPNFEKDPAVSPFAQCLQWNKPDRRC